MRMTCCDSILKIKIMPSLPYFIYTLLCTNNYSTNIQLYKIYIYYMIGLLVLMIMRILTRKLMKKIAELRKEIAELRKIKKLPMGLKTEDGSK